MENNDEPSSPKRRKLSTSGVIENDRRSQISMIVLELRYTDLEHEYGDILDEDTEPYLQEEKSKDRNVDNLRNGDKTPEVEEETDEGYVSGLTPVSLTKIHSVLQDAKFIAEIVSGVQVQEVYEKLQKRRKDLNRIDIVTNELLEGMTQQTVKEQNKDKRNSPVKEGKSSPSLIEDLVSVIDKTMMNLPLLPLTAEEITTLLEKHKDRSDRVDFVVSQVFIKHYKKREHQKEDLVADMLKILSEIPGADPGEVYSVLERNERDVNRIEKTIGMLKNKNDPNTSVVKEDSFTKNPELQRDPLFRDMRVIAKVLPHKDRNEIYAFLEAHYDKKNRIKLVIEEMMKDSDSQSIPGSVDTTHDGETKAATWMARTIQDEVDELREIFPDCDPNYLYDQLEQHQDDKDRVKNIAMKMFDKKNYPRLKDVLELQKKESVKRRFRNMEFDMTNFLEKFPNPFETFQNEEKQMNDNYKEHALKQLLTDYRNLKKGYVKQILESHNHHYYPSRKQIEHEIPYVSYYSKRFREVDRTPGKDTEMPETPDEFFFHEKLFLEHEQEIKDFLAEQKSMKELRLMEAKENGDVMECGCCYDDECLFEDMVACEDGHLFCRDCIKRSSEVVIGQGKTLFPCISGTCEYKFPLMVLQNILPSNMFSIILKKMQEEEIKMADIPDLVSCPFCNFATIMPDETDKVFKCLNPECLKESCRLCKELNHVPLRCNEVEKRGETDMRTYIESRLTEAMLRKCHRCNKYFVKEFGCNKMTCTCGATSCYVCRAEDIDYDHFDGREGRERCTNEGDMNKLHREEMEKAALEAKAQYLLDHPEATEMELKYDPLKHLDGCKFP
ncbi:hypothetical protein FSP39_020705 [Pinctada imbricata]|uniref:RING-type domain-containing protein n=1 Tax=Pinctada imbricata TaxID=66713 RepID=A0AA88XXI4_PINIB|nr:hypothetical protein FSP39_020705 [Pinctada imbricata]